ncbi:MAG: asparagine--tRNA ligase, partial [Erysipelotrichaceae bacterium]|nr:asparagine--tRNA ligase [Erysipelotrichaceae bacterium]
MLEYKTARELYELAYSKNPMEIDQLEYVEMEGWVRTNRNNGSIGFIELNDGSYFRNVQIVYHDDLANIEDVRKILTGASLSVTGKFIYTPDNKQPFELEAKEIKIIGGCDDSYPLQKKRHTMEYLRDIPHLRPRTNTFLAVFRLRSALAMAIHEFFQDQGFVYVHTPILTSNDGEGAGEMFTATTRKDDKYEKDFFGKEAFLTVSGQLHVESYCMAFRDVYT